MGYKAQIRNKNEVLVLCRQICNTNSIIEKSTIQVIFKNFNPKIYAPILYYKLQESCCFLCRKRRAQSSAIAHTQSKKRGQNLESEEQSCAGLDIQAPVPPRMQGTLTEDVATQGVWGKLCTVPVLCSKFQVSHGSERGWQRIYHPSSDGFCYCSFLFLLQIPHKWTCNQHSQALQHWF